MVTGILLTLFIGFLWSLVGIAYKFIAKENLSVFDIALVNAFLTIVVLLSILGWNIHTDGASMPDAGFCWLVIAGGCINAAGGYVLQWSMKYCRSSVAWAIGQSALIIPFLSITLIFNEAWLALKVIGTVVIIGGMLVLSFSPAKKTQEMPRPTYGIVLALISFLVLGIGQAMLSATSYMPFEDTAGYRPVLAAFGGLAAVIGGKIAVKEKGFRITKKALCVIVFYLVQGVISQTVQYHAMDALKVVGMNACFFPIAIGTCIALYSVWSVTVFKESTNRYVIGGTAAIVCGIAAYCFC
ncbi:MAG: hypothetical protein J6S98_09980 [Lentisphaeria bacterium]|nr:hypothetical protein [Lentisphaeria bacterium]